MSDTVFNYSDSTTTTSPDTILSQASYDTTSTLVSVQVGTVVTSIGDACFIFCSSLTSITIPSSVTSLGPSCFLSCSKLKSITIPDSVTSLDPDCFNGCSGLTSITIPSSVTSLGTQCFYSCSKLTSITIPSSVTSLGIYCFQTNNSSRILDIVFLDARNIVQGSSTVSSTLFSGVGGAYGKTLINSVTFDYMDQTTLINSTPNGTSLYNQFNNNGATISYRATCFNYDTKILTDKGYVPVQELKKGDIVNTYKQGYKPIVLIDNSKMINNPSRPEFCMHKMSKDQNNQLTEDLIVTGYHSILVDDLGEFAEQNKKYGKQVKVEDKFLLFAAVSPDFVKLENNDLYTYYHFSLESEDDDERFGIWANGVLTESTPISNFLKHFPQH